MKLAWAVLSLVGLSGCSFPDFSVVVEQPLASCDDGLRNGDETGMDCGMLACSKPCPAGQGCTSNADCGEAACVDSVCQRPSCADGLQNGEESDRDCGGTDGCRRCSVSERCQGPSDCDNLGCGSGRCLAASCSDGLLNGTESDLDCGGNGNCERCEIGDACGDASDCDSAACELGKCAEPSCSDGVQNQDETGLDCGGSCPRDCEENEGCARGTDCVSRVCNETTLTCAAPSCTDDVLNGTEPTIDCGTSCATKCATLDTCNVATDCATAACRDSRCVPAGRTGVVLSTLGWIATASHTASLADALPHNAIDSNPSSDWASGSPQAAGMWFRIDMQREQVFFDLEIDCTNTVDAAAKGIAISLSSDGSSYERVVDAAAGSDRIHIAFDEPRVARYLEVTLTQAGVNWWRINELRVKQ